MALFNFFNKKKENNHAAIMELPVNEPLTPALEEVKQDDISSNDKTADQPLVISYATGWPIDIIYGHLRMNYEEKGYGDAMVKSDLKFRDMNMELIKSRIRMTFKQVNLKYNVMLKDINIRKQNCQEAGLLTTISELNQTESIIIAHQEELKQLEHDFNNNEKDASIPLKSYECGFLRGIATIAMATGQTAIAANKPLEMTNIATMTA